jgi:hypothetical protein
MQELRQQQRPPPATTQVGHVADVCFRIVEVRLLFLDLQGIVRSGHQWERPGQERSQEPCCSPAGGAEAVALLALLGADQSSLALFPHTQGSAGAWTALNLANNGLGPEAVKALATVLPKW